MLQDLSAAMSPIAGGNFVTDDLRTILPLGIAGFMVWLVWIFRAVSSRFCRPIVTDFRTTTSVVVPSYREDASILGECLENWLSQDPTEVIVVVDVDDRDCIAVLRANGDSRLKIIEFKHEGKRSALGVGLRAATGEIVILADSDTRWLPGLVEAVQMPFADPDVGGVGTQQNVYQVQTSVWRKIADWMVDLRYYDIVPSMGRKGAVACLSGRTAAYRRSVILPLVPNLEHEFFLGRRCIAGDDGRLTWLVLASGFKTVHQRSARAMSMFPDTFRAFAKQRIRWSRNSYRTYLTAMWKGWLWRSPFVTKLTVLQILVTPVTMGLALGFLIFSRLEFTTHGYVLAGVWLLGGRLIRSYSHLRRRPQDIFLLPLYELMVILVALPIKLYALITMNKQGWLTRSAESVGGEGQNATTLTPAALPHVIDAVGPTASDTAPAPAPIRAGLRRPSAQQERNDVEVSA
jgi:N-acetylglucosaminyltransferase